MSEAPTKNPSLSYREAIADFLQERLNGKLEKLKPDDPKREELSEKLIASFAYDVWLANAAKRIGQIQAVTHSLKPIHPDASGTNLYVVPSEMATLKELGSHVLGDQFPNDVVGNAGALDVYKLLKLEVNGVSLLTALLKEDTNAIDALSADPSIARALRDAFVSLMVARTDASSHTLAKQLYWHTGADAAIDSNYTLLAPLYATSLAHVVYGQLQEDRFGEASKAACQARRERKMHNGVFRYYPGLAVQNMGGAHPQVISQLNLERRGANYLLSSEPPTWQKSLLHLPSKTTSVFDRYFGARPEVKRNVAALKKFLESNPQPNLATRQHREALFDSLVDELVCMAAEIHEAMPRGWTLDKERCQDLERTEQLWLDPLRGELSEEDEFAKEWLMMDWPDSIGRRFANWLNAQLKGVLAVGDVEARTWHQELLADQDGFVSQLKELRARLNTSNKKKRNGPAKNLTFLQEINP